MDEHAPGQRLTGKVAIVTGASKGIGKAIAATLAREGAKTILVARTQADLLKVERELKTAGYEVRAFAADVTNQEQLYSVVETTVREYGRIDILVNNAGMGVFKPVEEMTIEEFDRMWNVNMRGIFLATKAVLPSMTHAQSGNIINIASLAGKNSFKGGAGYAATKWALRGFAASLMLELRDRNIRVVTICPGSVDTNFSSMNLRGEGITQPQDVADAVLFTLTTPARTMISEVDIRPTNPH